MSDDRFILPLRQRVITGWFALNGFVVASWVAHIPRVSAALGVRPGTLGLALLCMAAGSVLGMVVAPWAIRRTGAGRAAWVAALAFALLLPLPLSAGSVFTLAAGLLLFGAAHGLLDVAMNKAAADHEQTLGRPVMAGFHGWFSVGMVAGVGAGAAALLIGIPPLVHAAIVIVLAVGVLSTGLPAKTSSHQPATGQPQAVGWGGRRVAALAGVAFICLFLEGAMADWSGLLAVAFGAGPAAAPLAYCAFTACWAVGRFVGDRLTSQTGDVFIVRAGGILAAVGVGLGLMGGTPVWVMAGCALTGLGIANVVPLLFRSAARTTFDGRGLAIVTGVGYAGFLVGPPLVGFAANAVGLPRAMWLVVVGGLALAVGAAVLRRQMTFNCRAVLLDMDGTLVDSSETVDAVWKEWATRVGVDPAPILAIHHGRRPAETLALTYPHLATPEAIAWVEQAQVGRVGVKPIPGAVELVDALAGRPWAVVTSASRSLAEDRLKAAGLWRGVPLIGADDVVAGKPSPEGYLLAARMLGVPPQECVVIEDAPAGVTAGNRAGMTIVGVATTHPASALDTPHIVLDLSAVTVLSGPAGAIRLGMITGGMSEFA